MAIVLASKSPRRRQLMGLVVPGFEVDEAAVDEAALGGGSAAGTALRTAAAKARNVAARRGGDVVVGCDTVVQAGEQMLGKPGGPQQAKQMLSLLSGRRHFVHTGVCIVLPGGAEDLFSACSAVDFTPIPPADIDAYVATDEAYDKAGGYGIQGWAARYILGIEGCFYNVMGLPVAALHRALVRLGVTG